MKPSKNSIRKENRREFHAVMHALTKNSTDEKALSRLHELKEKYFAQVDGALDSLDTNRAEKAFVADVRSTLNEEGWVTVYRPDGRPVQMKSSLWEYIKSRQRRDILSATAAEHLAKRAVGSIQQRRMLPK